LYGSAVLRDQPCQSRYHARATGESPLGPGHRPTGLQTRDFEPCFVQSAQLILCRSPGVGKGPLHLAGSEDTRDRSISTAAATRRPTPRLHRTIMTSERATEERRKTNSFLNVWRRPACRSSPFCASLHRRDGPRGGWGRVMLRWDARASMSHHVAGAEPWMFCPTYLLNQRLGRPSF